MSLLDNFKDKVKDASGKAGSAVAREYQKQQQQVADRKEEKAKAVAFENTRHQKIQVGELLPIPATATMNLQVGETAYLELPARRLALVDSVIQETVGTSKKKHIIRRAVVGGVLTGGVGAIVGGATAGSKHKSTTTERIVSSTEVVDSGQLILTDKRFIFVGNNVISRPYEEVVTAQFRGNKAIIKYADMLNGEHYEVFGSAAKDAQLYYDGIRHMLSAKTVPQIEQANPHTEPAASIPQDRLTDALTRLAKLKEQRLITEADYNAKKKQLLGL